jgi:putative transposase
LAENGVQLISTDEMTGIQALERAYPTKSMIPGKVKRIEFEYIRHGTLSLIANWDIATGQVIEPSIGPTRTEIDFANHITKTIDTDPEAGWIFIVDQLNTHQSESLVKLVASRCQIDIDLGVKGKKGILASMKTRWGFFK